MKKVIVVSCLLLVVSYLLVSCGLKTETTRYFYGPSWVRGGEVIFVGEVNTADKDVLGSQLGSSYSQYVATMSSAGTNESSSLFDTTDTSVYALSCSPFTDYVAYMIGLRSGLFSTIVIRNIATGVHTGLEMVELNFSPGIKAFDWSPDGTKLVYCTTTEVRIVDVDGANDALVVAESGLEFVSWKYGGRIVFSGANSLLSLIYPDGSGRLDVGPNLSVDTPQISPSNTNEVFGTNANNHRIDMIDVSGSPTAITVINSVNAVLPRISPNGNLLTYSKVGETSGVYVLDISDINNPVETKIK